MAKQTFTTGQVLTAAQMTSLQQTAMLGGAASAKTDSYVLTAADAGTAVSMNKATATTITVNTGLFAAGDTVTILNIGAGTCTITAGTATVSKPNNATLALVQNAGGVLYFTATGAATFMPFDVGATGVGMTYLTGATFSAVTSVSLPNNSFSATYDNYYLTFQLTGASAAADLAIRFRASGSDNTSASYYCGFRGLSYAGASADSSVSGGTSASFGTNVDNGGPTWTNYGLWIYSPLLARKTVISALGTTSAATLKVGTMGHDSNTVFDALTFLYSSGNITGNYRLYGLANSQEIL